MRRFFAGLIFVLLGISSVHAEEERTLFGVWATRGDGAHVLIHRCEDGKLVCGSIVWTASGKPDRIGAAILTGFAFEDGRLRGGRIIDPRSGSRYRARLEMIDEGLLKVEGCVLIFCGDQEWTRVPDEIAGRDLMRDAEG